MVFFFIITDLKRGHFRPYHDKGTFKKGKWGKEENSDSPLLQAQQVRDYLFGVTNGERAKRLLLAACVGLSFPNIFGQ